VTDRIIEEEEKKGEEEKDQKEEEGKGSIATVMLPALIRANINPVKALTKESLNRVTEMLQNAKVTRETSERLVVLWGGSDTCDPQCRTYF
jgi:hypothetical protein